ncbi:MAG: FAD-dependent oxidoreductase [Nitrospiraceae bacterium]|nr:FAD-dependent oxidoreductase [Nitrospiraceae bacterium]
MKVVIIGCGAAGATAAQFARKNDRKAEIKIFEKGGYPEYSKCALPFVISGKLSPESVIEFSEDWFRKADIDLHLNTAVSSVDFDARVVETSEGIEEYDALIIATGASPSSPVNFEGKTYFLRTLDDAIAIREAAKKAENAIIIGAGLIGLEAAEALSLMGVKVTVVEFLPDLMLTMVDSDVARIVREKISDKIEGKVNMLFNHRVTSIKEGKDGRMEVEIAAADASENREVLHGDFVIIAAGNKANAEIAGQLAENGMIKVDERCETSVKNVYAVGDCTRYRDILGNAVQIGLGSVAVRQGMVAGANAVGGDKKMQPLVNARTTKIFGVEVAAAGPPGRQIDGISGKFKGSTLPEYMEGEEIFIKVHADKKGRIIGAQAVGPEATQRINKFSLAIQYGLSLQQIMEAETAYAPALAPVIDASSIACEIANRRVK